MLNYQTNWDEDKRSKRQAGGRVLAAERGVNFPGRNLGPIVAARQTPLSPHINPPKTLYLIPISKLT